MTYATDLRCTAFAGTRRIASGPLADVAAATKAALDAGEAAPIQIFDDATGRPVELDFRGTAADVLAGLGGGQPSQPEAQAERRGPGRPRLGVVAREVTLLPRHWDWLAAQPGGASVALRRLVDQARRATEDEDLRRAAREAAYRFMNAMAGDLPAFEEAIRALFAGDRARFDDLIAGWPQDVRAHSAALAEAAFPA